MNEFLFVFFFLSHRLYKTSRSFSKIQSDPAANWHFVRTQNNPHRADMNYCFNFPSILNPFVLVALHVKATKSVCVCVCVCVYVDVCVRTQQTLENP